jgi:hypothetical protein
VLGVSLSAALTQSVLTTKLTEGIKGPHASEVCFVAGSSDQVINLFRYQLIDKIRHATGYIDKLSPHNKAVAIEAYTAALKVVFVCQIALAGLTLLSLAGIQENDLPDKAKPEAVKPAGQEEA